MFSGVFTVAWMFPLLSYTARACIFVSFILPEVQGWQVHPPTRIVRNDPWSPTLFSTTRLEAATETELSSTIGTKKGKTNKHVANVVLLAGFESFNRQLYQQAATSLDNIDLTVLSDGEIRTVGGEPNPVFINAVQQADIFIGSLIFDYDDVQVVRDAISVVPTRLIFESATELMELNQVGTFNMIPSSSGVAAGPPPAVKAVLSKFSSGKEEDKLNGYLQFLKIGPDLLKFIPGTGDLRTWLEAYRYWNQGGILNASSMLKLLVTKCCFSADGQSNIELPPVVITPDVGLLHPLKPNYYWTSPKEYLDWRLDQLDRDSPLKQAPRVAILLYRKHVITGLRYINDLIKQMENCGLMPIPIFINGVEAHTIVRDLLTSSPEEHGARTGKVLRDSSFQRNKAVRVDAIVNTIGFPLVGDRKSVV